MNGEGGAGQSRPRTPGPAHLEGRGQRCARAGDGDQNLILCGHAHPTNLLGLSLPCNVKATGPRPHFHPRPCLRSIWISSLYSELLLPTPDLPNRSPRILSPRSQAHPTWSAPRRHRHSDGRAGIAAAILEAGAGGGARVTGRSLWRAGAGARYRLAC